jgi:hypothetical protein
MLLSPINKCSIGQSPCLGDGGNDSTVRREGVDDWSLIEQVVALLPRDVAARCKTLTFT